MSDILTENFQNYSICSITKKLKRYSGDFINNQSINIHKVFIESHRGVSKEEPENTLLAFEKAIEIGCDSIEMDIWLTNDKVPIIIHGDSDGNIEFNTNYIKSDLEDQKNYKDKKQINSISFEEISKIKLAKNQKIPSLREVLLLCKNKIFLNLELKDPNFEETFEEVLKLLIEFDMKNEVQVSSFHHNYWETIEKNGHFPYLEFGFLYDRIVENKLDIDFKVNNYYRFMLNLWYKDVSKEIVDIAHENKIAVLAYFSMDDIETDEIFNFLIGCGIDVICTNDPRNALRIRDEYYKLKL